jgi:hypothetical protein
MGYPAIGLCISGKNSTCISMHLDIQRVCLILFRGGKGCLMSQLLKERPEKVLAIHTVVGAPTEKIFH